MKMRQAERSDIRTLATLWTQAFPDRRTVSDRVRQLEAGVPYGGIETAWIAEEAGQILGAFRAYRFTEYVAGATLPMLGLAAVATAPGARRRGVGRALCRHAIRVGRERGDVVSVLYPFRPAFYRAVGWGLVGELHTYRFVPDALPVYDEVAGVRPAGPNDRDAIIACYARVAARSNGPVAREARVWPQHLDAEGIYAFVFADGEVQGYVLVHFGRSRRPGGGTLQVRELIAENETARRGLLGWIATQRDQFAVVRYDARPSERLELILSDQRPPGFKTARALWYATAIRIRGPMLRVLDVPAALAARSWRSAGSGTALSIEVIDDEVPDNHGPWTLTIEDGGAEVRAQRSGDVVAARLVVDAPTFAQLYTGELNPGDAARLGLARVEGDVEALDRAFRVDESFWLLDEF